MLHTERKCPFTRDGKSIGDPQQRPVSTFCSVGSTLVRHSSKVSCSKLKSPCCVRKITPKTHPTSAVKTELYVSWIRIKEAIVFEYCNEFIHSLEAQTATLLSCPISLADSLGGCGVFKGVWQLIDQSRQWLYNLVNLTCAQEKDKLRRRLVYEVYCRFAQCFLRNFAISVALNTTPR